MSTVDDLTQSWMRYKKENPVKALALSVLPGTGQATAAAEYYDAMQRGDSVDGVMAAVQFAPGGGLLKAAKFAKEARASYKFAGGLADAARNVAGDTARSSATRAGLADMATVWRGHAAVDGGKAVAAGTTTGANLAEFFNDVN